MKKGCLIAIVIFIVLSAGFIYMLKSAFGPEYSTEEIKQDIGGKLLLDIVYYGDHHSWDYEINYKYLSKTGDTINIGDGTYHGREYPKKTQLIKYGKWIILPTGTDDADKIIIGDFETEQWKEFEFTPQEIEKDSLWVSRNINSLQNYLPSQSYIQKLEGGHISILYKFRTDGEKPDELGLRTIQYQINKETGIPKMISIK